ncbi:MAG: AMP-binding protein [Nocardioidaceae bacterium]
MTTFDDALAEIRRRQDAAWPDQVPREPSYPLEIDGVVDYLRHWGRERPDHEAIWFYGRSITYAELDAASDRFAGWLLAHGTHAGDRVGVFLANCPQFTIAMMGILKAGCVHVPVNPLFREHELAHELGDAGVSVLLAQSDLVPLVEAARAGSAVRVLAATGLDDMLPAGGPVGAVPFAAAPPAPEPYETWAEVMAADPAPTRPTDPDALAALNYTGGTTGMPKGCEHTQRHMVYTAVTATAAQGHRVGEHAEVAVVFLPIFWIAGEDFGVLIPIVNGGTVVLMTRWDADAVLDVVESHRATTMIGTVDNYVELMDRPDFAGRDLSSLESGLAVSFVLKLTPEIRHSWRAATGHTLREASYGMTETHTADSVTLGFQDGDRDLSADPVFCGLPVPGTDFLVIDDAGAPVGVDVPGQILVRSPSLLTRYYGKPEASADVLRDGWLHTGDTGKLNAQGALHYLGRTKEMIKTNGMSVFPSEVEALFKHHPDVTSVAVVPMADAERGQVPLAFVQLRGGSAEDAGTVRAWARENMATYKVPVVEIVPGLPMTATGKVKKGELFERAAQRARE